MFVLCVMHQDIIFISILFYHFSSISVTQLIQPGVSVVRNSTSAETTFAMSCREQKQQRTLWKRFTSYYRYVI